MRHLRCAFHTAGALDRFAPLLRSRATAATTAAAERTPRRAACGRRAVSCHAGNGAAAPHDSSHGGDRSSDASELRMPSDVQQAKQQLLQLISSLVNDGQQLRHAELLIRQLERSCTPPSTSQFTEMAISGSWNLLFSSMRTSTRGNVRIRRIEQLIQPQHRLLINQASFTFPDLHGVAHVHAIMRITCSYQFVSAHRLKVQLSDHEVKLLPQSDGKANVLPRDLKRVITEMQLALPLEFFDPSGLVDVTYVDPTLRICRFLGKRMAGVCNVLAKKSSEYDDAFANTQINHL